MIATDMQSQQTTRAPFFKPLSPPSLNPAVSDSTQERLLQDKQRASNQSSRTKDLSWDTIQSASLHARLQQEAEKIRRWKLSTELDLKQRERKITECQSTIEQQRKALLDLQLETEDLTVRLQNEVSNQQEVQHKIETTRDMCTALKDHATKVDTNVQQGETDRSELKSRHQAQVDKMQDLVTQFHQLELQCTVEHENTIKQHEEEKANLTAAKNTLQAQIETLRKEQGALQISAGQSSEKITLLSQQLEEMERAKQALEDEKGAICDKLRHSESVSESQSVQIESLAARLEASQNMIQQLTDRTHLLQSNIAELEKEQKLQLEQSSSETQRLTNDLESARNELCEIKSELEKEEKRALLLLGDLEAEQRKVDGLLSEKDSIEKMNSSLREELCQAAEEKDTLESQLESMQSQKSALEETLAAAHSNYLSLKDSLEGVETHLEAAHKDLATLKADCAALSDKNIGLQDELAIQKGALANMHSDLEKARTSQRDLGDQLHSTEGELETLKTSHAQLSIEVDSLKECKETLEKEHQSISSALDSAKSEIKNHVETETEQKKMISDMEEESAQLREKIEQTQENASSASGKAGEALEKKQQQIKTLKKDLAEEVKKVRASEKQVRVLETRKADLEQETIERDAKIDELSETLKGKDEVLNVLNNKITQLEELQQQAQAAVESEREAQMQYELKSQELCATLEKYQIENQKIVERKDKEVEDLKLHVRSVESKHKEEQLLAARKDDEIQQLQQQLKEQKLDLDTKVKEMSDKLEKFEGMEMDIQEKCAATGKENTPATNACKAGDQEMDMSPPYDSQIFKSLPRTPRANASKSKTSSSAQTPRSAKPSTPAATSTPGILRTGPSSQYNKRKVIFAGDQERSKSPDTSEDTLQDTDALFQAVCKTPVIPAKSPKLSTAPTTPRSNIRLAPTTPTRQSPAAKQPRLAAARAAVRTEKEQFVELFPEKSIPPVTSREKKRANSIQSSRSMKKLKIKSSDGASKKPKPDETNWFDTDTVFGFRPEE
ncbi:synaptonemal complex protein 1-like [Sycon ciliatum]|uniref:synaptonemal complex protein 1-like n=1 Tax=Sycon ciliatum TaxID=27933 RepID=UPI0031F65D41